MAKEWGRYKVNVNAVAFGLIMTRLTEAPAHGGATIDISGREIPVGVRPEVLQTAEKLIPLGRGGLRCFGGRRCGGRRRLRRLVIVRGRLLGRDPFVEIRLRLRLDDDRHEGVVDAADLVALAVIDAFLVDVEPRLVEAADDGIHLNAEGRDEPAMHDVGAGD